MELNLSIRESTTDDSEQIAKISVAGWQQAYKGILPDTFLSELDWQPRAEGRKKFFEDADRKSFVYLVDGKITGFCDFGPARKVMNIAEIDSTCAEIYAIYVLPEYQKAGIGMALFKKAINFLKDSGYNLVFIWSLEDNSSAHKFYAKCGCEMNPSRKSITIDEIDYTEIAYVYDLSL